MGLSAWCLVLPSVWWSWPRFQSPSVWNTSTNDIATVRAVGRDFRKQRLHFGLLPMLRVIWTCLWMHVLIKYECRNNITLMKPTVNTGTAGVFIFGLAVWKDANKEKDQSEDVMWVPTRLCGPYCCLAPGFHLLLFFFLKSPSTQYSLFFAMDTISLPLFPCDQIILVTKAYSYQRHI